MRPVHGFLLSFLILAFGFTSSISAQTNSNAANVPDSVLRSLTFSPKLPEFVKNLSSDQSSRIEPQDDAKPELNLGNRAQNFLQHALDRDLMTGSSECGHILIYVPPVTDTKMIIRVPGNSQSPDGTPNIRANPPVKVCGQDLRRVDGPRPAPPPNANRDGTLLPLRQIALPH